MLIIPQAQFLAELSTEKSKSQIISSNKDESPIIPDEIVMENHNYDNFRKKDGEKNTPTEVKAVIGALAESHTREELSELFNISKDTVGDLALDKHSNSKVSETKINILERCKEITLTKLEASLDFLTISRDMKPREQVAIAESLARIHEKITPKDSGPLMETKFIFYSPERQNDIKDYEIIDAAV